MILDTDRFEIYSLGELEDICLVRKLLDHKLQLRDLEK